MAKMFAVQDFFKRFPTDDACLEHLMQIRYGAAFDCPKCGKYGNFSRIKKLPAFQCAWCGHHVHPMAGTPFEASRTPLQKWFYAMYLFTTSRHGVPAKELQRQLSVTYKCAWRMGHEIRKYMAKIDGNTPLSGTVEVDETLIGGKMHGGGGGRNVDNKAIVMGMVERGGDIMTKVVPDIKGRTLQPIIFENIKVGTTVYTDELRSYKRIKTHGYVHTSVNHKEKQYVNGDCHTNTIEGFWARLKLSIRGTHVHVSTKHLAKYLGEFEFRYNMRRLPEFMFQRLLLSF